MPFERLILLHLGGKRLLNDLMGKKVNDDVEFVYDYLLTSENFDAQRPAFLKVKDREEFNSRYSVERDNQANALNGEERIVKSSLFAGELMELYQLIRTVLRAEPEVEINIATANCLPVHSQRYLNLNINALEHEVTVKQDSLKHGKDEQFAENEFDFQEGLGEDHPLSNNEKPENFSAADEQLHRDSEPELKEEVKASRKDKSMEKPKQSKIKPIYDEAQLD